MNDSRSNDAGHGDHERPGSRRPGSARQPRGEWRRASFVLALLFGSVSGAAEGPEEQANRLEFRRVQVQSEQLAELARGHLPIREAEFNQLLAEGARRARQFGPNAVGCTRAEYSARFENDALVDGRAMLDVHSEATSPALWTWRETNLPVKNPQWRGDPPRAAWLGLVASGSQAVLVESSGTLAFDWSRQGQRVSRDAVTFSLRMPHGTFQSLTLDLPSSIVPLCRDAIVQRLPPSAPPSAVDVTPKPGSEPDPASKAAPGESNGSRVAWRIEWQGDRELDLRLVLSTARRSTSPVARVRQDLLYSIDPRGLELQADLHIDVGTEPLRSLVLAIDRRLRISAVRLGDKPLAWNRRSAPDGAAHDELIVQIPELSGEDRWIQCSALAPIELGTSWRLPSLQPQGMLWLEGEAQVIVHDPLVATHLDARGGRLVGSTGATAERRRSWRIRLQDPDAQCTLIADIPSTRLRIRCGTSITADISNMSAQYVAELTPLNGSVFALDADFPRAWLIDGLESVAGPVIEEYQISASATQGRQHLRVRLREPLAANKTLRLAIRARRTPPTPNTAIGAEQLRLLRFRDGNGVPHDVEHLVAVNNAPNTRVRFSGDQAVTWIDPSTLAEAEAALVETSSGGRIFVADRAADDLEIRFERDRPRFRAELEVAASIRAERLVEFYRLRLIPDASALDRLPIYFTRARSPPLQWKLDEPREPAPSFRRVTPSSGSSTDLGETWEVAFARPLSSPVILTAERSSPLSEVTTISLISLPEASEQRGRLQLAANTGSVKWINRGLRPVADVEPNEVDSVAHLLGVAPGTVAFFEYEPTSGGAASVSFEQAPPLLARAWATQAHLVTTAVPDGTLSQRCEYEVENMGAFEVTFGLDSATRLQRLMINGADRTPPDPETNAEGTRREFTCALPMGVRSVRIQLELATRQPRFGLFHELELPRVTTSFPVLAQQWRVSLPQAWAVWGVAESPGQETNGAAEYDPRKLWPVAQWKHRLFGLILRDETAALVESDEGRSGWDAGQSDLFPPPLGWHHLDLKVAPERPLSLRVCRTSVLLAIAWVTLLVAAAFVGWIGSRWWWALPGAALMAGVFALFAPGVVSVVGSGWFLGTLLAPWVARALCLSHGRREETPRTREGTTLTAGAVVSLLLVAFIASEWLAAPAVSTAIGQDAPPANESTPAPAPRVVHRVLVPVDEQRERVGDYVHLPREFYHELRRQAGVSEAVAAAFVIHSAEYDVSLRDGDSPLVDVVVDYGVEVRQAETRVTWPFAAGLATLIETSVTRGGEPIETDSQAEEGGLSTTFAQPGSYRVLFHLHVPPSAVGATNAELAVPPIAGSQVLLRSEGTAARLNLANDACGPEEIGTRGERRLNLGPTPRLRFSWSATGEAPAMAAADHLYWLHVRPGSVQLDFSMRLTPAMIPPSRMIRLRPDPKLRLLPVVGSEAILRVQPLPGQSGVLQLELAESDEPIDLRLSFLLSRATGVGRIVVPQVEWLEGRSDRRWLAVTVAPSLELSRQEGGAMEPLQVPAFLQTWGATDALPLVAYRLSLEDEAAVLAIRQHEVEWTASETTSYTLRRDRGELAWVADIAVGIGPVFQYQVQCDADTRILDVALLEGSEQTPRPIRWALDQQGGLRILTEQGLSGPHRLRVRADFPLSPDKEIPLPALTLAARQPAPRTVHIFRNDSVLIDQIAMEGWMSQSAAGADDSSQLAARNHGVGSWSWKPLPGENAPTNPLVQFRLNRPRSRGRLLTSLFADRERWHVEVTGLIQPERGRIERVRLEVPADWTGPWSGDEAEPWTQRSAPGQVRAQLVREVGQDAPASIEFRLRGDLRFSRQERPRAPDVQLLDAVAVERYLALPTHDRGHKIVWKSSGLRAVVQPDQWLLAALANHQAAKKSSTHAQASDPAASAAPPPSAATPFQLYQIVSPRFQAAIVDVNEESPEARIRDAEHRVQLRSDGAGWGQTTFVAQAGGQDDCIVDLPLTERMVQVRVGGEFAVVDRLEDGGWRIPLVDSFATQEIDVLYQLAPAASRRRLEERLPRVRQWPTDHTSIHAAGKSSSASPDHPPWIAALALIGATLAVVGLHFWHGWRDWLAGGPSLPAVLFGIGWWLWFEPQFLGVLIGAAGVLLANLPSTIRLGTKRGL